MTVERFAISFDRELARLVRRSAKTNDVCDAHVAIVAVAIADVLYTSDPTDLRRLIAACHTRTPTIVRC